MTTDEVCPFCNLKDAVLLKNELAVAFLSSPRKVKGHFLVTTRRHVEKTWELTEAELLAVYDLIFKIEQKLIPALGEGADIRQNYRPFLTQSRLKVDHIHFHVIPRRKFDHMYEVAERFDTVLFEKLTDEEAAEVKDIVSSN